MLGRKKNSKLIEDQKLLEDLNSIHEKLEKLMTIKEHAIDISDELLFDIKIEEMKYRFLYHEARRRNVHAQI